MKKLILSIISLSLICLVYPAWALMAYSPEKKILVYVNKGDNKIMYRKEGANQTWYTANGLRGSAGFNEIIYEQGKFIAIANYSTIWYSENGIDWKIAENLTGQTDFKAIIHTKNGFIVVGNGEMHGTWTSRDGIKWTDRINGIFGLRLKALASDGNNRIVAVGAFGDAVFSVNGGFTLHYKKNKHTVFNDIAYGKNKFIAVGSYVYSSPDGEKWDECVIDPSSFDDGLEIEKVRYIPEFDKFIAFSDEKHIWYSEDGKNWLQAKVTDSPQNFIDISDVAPTLIKDSNSQSFCIYFSIDKGKTWQRAKSPQSFFDHVDSFVKLADGSYFAIAQNFTYRSTDAGKTWVLAS